MQYFVYLWMLTMVSSATFLKLPYAIKLVMLSIMLLVYTILVKLIFTDVFSHMQACGISLLNIG